MIESNTNSRETSARQRSAIRSAKIPFPKIKRDVLKKFYFIKDLTFRKQCQIKKKHEKSEYKKTINEVNQIL